MKQLLLELSLHHEWANKVLFKRLETVPAEILENDMGSSFVSINKTIFHLLTAETIWWQRVQLKENVISPDSQMAVDFPLMASEILKFSANWVNLISNAAENKLQHVFEYRNSKREFFKQHLYKVLLHLFNHQTYHHGQIITMLRQQKVEKLPATDFIEFIRKKGKA